MRLFDLLAVLALAGCTPDYPLDRPGTWSLDNQPSANDADLRAMVANPHDLVSGAAATNALGGEAAGPVKLLLSGQRAPLPESNSLNVENSAPPPTQQAPPQSGNQ